MLKSPKDGGKHTEKAIKKIGKSIAKIDKMHFFLDYFSFAIVYVKINR
jgi:hypothetical protein